MVVNRQGRLEDNIAGSGVKISENSPAENQYAYPHPTEDALDKSMDAFIAIKASAYLTHSNCRRCIFENFFFKLKEVFFCFYELFKLDF